MIGNPPFVRNERLPIEDREVLNEQFSAIKSGNTDLSAYFLYYAMKYWLKEGGILGMVAPIGIVNTKMAELLRGQLSEYSIFQIVSLEWMAKEIFPDADIIPMLIFIRKEHPKKSHKITIVTGLRHKAELRQAVEDKRFFAKHASQLEYQKWLTLSQTGDWPIEVKVDDIPLLEKLKNQSALGGIIKTSYAVKLGESNIARPYDESKKKPTDTPFLKGQHICTFSLTDADEMVDLKKISQASGAGLWRDLTFFRENEGKADDSGLGRDDYNGHNLLNDHPSDTLCCFVPEVYVTLIAGVANPLEMSANNSVVTVIPYKYSAHVIAAIINSRISRYYSFMLLRSALLLRRRAHWYPRTVENLPLPNLKDAQARQLHQLAKEASLISQGVHLNELDAYLDLMPEQQKLTKAGFLGIQWSDNNAMIDRDDLTVSRVEGSLLKVGGLDITGENQALHLLRLALLALDKEEIEAEVIQNILLPSDAAERTRVAEQVTGVSAHLEQVKSRTEQICEAIDEIVAEGLGLTPSEHEIIRQRCQEFPLSVTVERPRYVWSPDRKRQARRIYEPGKRFK